MQQGNPSYGGTQQQHADGDFGVMPGAQQQQQQLLYAGGGFGVMPGMQQQQQSEGFGVLAGGQAAIDDVGFGVMVGQQQAGAQGFGVLPAAQFGVMGQADNGF